MAYLVMGIALAFNLIIIKYKLDKDRTLDAVLDAGALILLGIVFGGTISGLIIATIASAIISFWLLLTVKKKTDGNI